jgi:hypothetical protein
MSVRVELHCDARTGLRCTALGGTARSGSTVQVVVAKLHERARQDGWAKQRGVGWLCPACARLTDAAPLAAAA